MNNPIKIEESDNPEIWVDQYADYLYQFAYYRTKNMELAEDFVQDTFVSALANWQNFQGKSSVKTWLTAILRNKIIDYYRSVDSKVSPTDFQDSKWENDFNNAGIWKVWVSDWAKQPDHLFESKRFQEVLKDCFSSLADRLQTLFKLQILEGYNTEEICKELNISTSNYWVVVHRARMQLRKCLDSKSLESLS